MIWNINKQANKQTNKQAIRTRKKNKKNEDSVSSLWDNYKQSNIHFIGMPGGEEKGQEIRNLYGKKMKENFPNLVKEIDMQVHEIQSPPNKMDSRGPLQDTS